MITRLVTLATLMLLTSASAVTAQEQPRMGGVLKAGMIGEAPTLDLHVTTAVITQQITWHVYETLFTLDKNLAPIPMLAEGHAIADNGRRYSITLRKGVRFHNGKEMTSADVVSSLQHWSKLATPGKAIWKNVEGIEAKDPYTVVIYLKEPSGSLLFALASPNNGAAIYPKEVVAAAGDGAIKEYIGTGPYRFVEHKPDRHVRLARFKEYSARSDPPNGYGGKRTAYIDEIYFIPVPEASVRLAGTETGEYNFAQSIRQDQADRIKGQSAVEAQVVKPYGWITAVPNHKEGVMANKKVRQAFQAVLDMEPIMSAGIGNKGFYRLDGAMFYPEQPQLYSLAGTTGYNQKNKAKARQLLKEAGYAGCTTPLSCPRSRWRTWASRLTSRCSTGRRSSSGGTNPSCSTSSRRASRSRPTRPSPRRSSATGPAGGASRKRTSSWPRWRGRRIRRSGARSSRRSRRSSTRMSGASRSGTTSISR